MNDLLIIPDWLTNAFNAFPEHIYMKDNNRRFVFANTAMMEAVKPLNITSLKERRDEDLFTDPHLSRAKEDEEIILTFARVHNITEKLELETWIDHRLTWVATTKRAIIDSSGLKIGLIGISREVKLHDYEHTLGQMAHGVAAHQSHPAGIYYQTLDMSKGIVWSNGAFQELFPGSTKKDKFRLIHEDDKQSVSAFLHALLKAPPGYMESVDFRARLRGHLFRWVRGHGLIYLAEGRRQMLVAHQDIGASKMFDVLTNRIINALPCFLFAKDENQRFTYMNRSLLQFLVKELDDVLGKTDKELGFTPQELATFSQGDTSILSGKQEEYIAFGETLTAPNGVTRTLVTIKWAVPASAFDPNCRDAKSRHVLGISTDVSEIWQKLHDSHELWNSLLTNSSDAIFVKNSDGVYIDANPAFIALFHRLPSDVIGKTTKELWTDHPDLLENVLKEDRQILKDKRTISGSVRTIKTPDGSFRIGSTSKIPVLDQAGRVHKILGVSRDITHLQQALAFARYVPTQLRETIFNPPAPTYRCITVTFCDIRGFSALTRQLSAVPYVLFKLLKAFSTMVAEVVDQHGAILDKFMGDGAMILGGAVEADDDEGRIAAKQAVEIGIELRQKFVGVVKCWHSDNRGKLKRLDYGLQLGIGIHVGEAIVGYFSAGNRDQFTAFGDVVNIAQRLESCACRENRGSIMISLPVYHLVEHAFKAVSLGDICPPKETEPIAVFDVLGSIVTQS